jgi:3-hydroxybutyryl-CoA dehydrogenase
VFGTTTEPRSNTTCVVAFGLEPRLSNQLGQEVTSSIGTFTASIAERERMVRDQLDRIGVVGAGTMGSGIAQVAAASGYEVVLRDIEDEFLERGFETIDNSLGRLEKRDALDEAPGTIRDRISGTTALETLADCDLVVEAALEEMAVKQDIFADLERVCDDDVVLATNTSTLSITSIAAVLEHPERVVGLHFMNPVPIMEGVEVVVGEKTTDEVTRLAHDLAEDLGKTTWESDDKPGFVTNRILMPWLNEGIRAYDEGVASKEDIDAGMELGTNVPMGPLTLADHIGLDICLHATETLYEELGDRYKPAYLLKRKVEAGDLGKKTGEGFYQYE